MAHLVFPLITTFIMYGVVTPYLPIMVRSLGYSPSTVGILLGVFEGAGIAGPFLFGFFADRWGQYKPGLIVMYVLMIASALPLALFFSPLISALFLAVLAIGFRSAIPMLDAVITINLGKNGNYGKIRTVGSASFIVMVLFLQWTHFLRPDTSFNIALWITISAALALVSMSLIPSKYTGRGKVTITPKDGNTKTGSIWSPLFIMGLVIIFLSRLAMAPVNGFLSMYVTEELHWDATGLIWAISSLAEVPVMYISWRLIRRFGALPLLVFTTLMVGVRLGIYAVFPFKPGVIAAQLLHSFCYGLFHPAAVAFISGSVPPERRAMGMSLYLSLGTGLPTLLGNIMGGFIIEHWGYRLLFISYTVFPLIAMGIYFFMIAKTRRRCYL
ncbi:MAG: MFS transporter [Treponema sp.]|jgi:PPP family 3-phenylpropionic acid transporter|nr:MFS transporter [Treponema sp.]